MLAKVARLILCIPATFSTAGLTVTKLRSCLKPENVDALVFLNKNFEYLFKSVHCIIICLQTYTVVLASLCGLYTLFTQLMIQISCCVSSIRFLTGN